MQIKIEITPSYRIAYIRHIGPYGEGNIQTMETLKSYAKSNNLLDDESIILGIAQDNPEMTEPEQCRYDTCLVIPEDYCIQDDFVKKGQLKGGKYAVFEINHTAKDVQKAWSEIVPELIKHGYQMDDTRLIMERYEAKMVKNHKCEICVPIY